MSQVSLIIPLRSIGFREYKGECEFLPKDGSFKFRVMSWPGGRCTDGTGGLRRERSGLAPGQCSGSENGAVRDHETGGQVDSVQDLGPEDSERLRGEERGLG